MEKKCCICHGKLSSFEGDFGNNPAPLMRGKNNRCCNNCNDRFVTPVRILQLQNDKKEEYK